MHYEMMLLANSTIPIPNTNTTNVDTEQAYQVGSTILLPFYAVLIIVFTVSLVLRNK